MFELPPQPAAVPLTDQPSLEPSRHRLRLDLEWTGRLVVIGWCMWLLGTWAVTLMLDSAVPAARLMAFSSALALLLLWPVVRLSQDGCLRIRKSPKSRVQGPESMAPGKQPQRSDPGLWALDSEPCIAVVPVLRPGTILRDWVSLLLILQAVLWPLCLTTHWTAVQTGWLDAAVASWSLLTGFFIAAGCMSGRGVWRTVAMAACLLVALGEPVAAAAAPALGASRWALFASPAAALWDLTARPRSWQLGIYGVQVLAVSAVAMAAWVMLFIATRNRHMTS